MRRIFTALIITLVIVGVLLTISALFFPSTWKFQKKISIKAPVEKVYNNLIDLKNWPQWSAWSADRMSEFRCEFPGETKGKGALMNWESKRLGKGVLHIDDVIKDARITYHIDMVSYRASKGQIIIYPGDDGNTDVIWINEGKVGKYDPIGKYIALLAGKTIGRDIEYSLDRLKDASEK